MARLRRFPLAVVLLTAVTALAAVGCATTGTGSSDGPDAADYAAAAVGNAWTYRVTPGPDEPQTVRMVSRDDRGFYVDDRGGRLAPRSDGLFDGTRFLLKEPLTAGATWIAVTPGPRPGVPGPTENYRIVATGLEVTVPAGTFANCVEVEATTATRDPNSGKAATLVMSWVWAPKTGMIRLQQSVRFADNSPSLPTATMELVSFTPASTPASTTTSTTTATVPATPAAP
jgi:hypothetical protein